MISKAKNAVDVLMLYPGDVEARAGASQRKVTRSWQLSLPAALLESVGLDCSDWVYISAGSDGRSLRVTPAEHTTGTSSKLEPAGSRVGHR